MAFLGFRIDGPVLVVRGKEFPINMISAEVIIGGQTSNSRSTVTRIVGGGLVAGVGGAMLGGAAKKTQDTSKIYVSVATPDGEVVTKSAPVTQEKIARHFADRLNSAANRKWPLETPFGSVIPLDPSSKRSGEINSSFAMSAVPIGVAIVSIILGFAVHPALFAGLLLAIVVWIVFAVVEGGKDGKALDEKYPGWKERQAELNKRKADEMWRKAREKE